MFPALAGGFLTTGRPEKPSFVVLRFSFFISDFKQFDYDMPWWSFISCAWILGFCFCFFTFGIYNFDQIWNIFGHYFFKYFFFFYSIPQGLQLYVHLATCSSFTSQCFQSVISVTQSCPTLYDPMNHSTPGLPAAAKSLQSCPTLCDPIDGSPPSSPVPGILQARTLEWVSISFSNA